MQINNIPCTINFSEEPKQYSNLLKVKLVVMHEGANRNDSSFSMQSIEQARESLKNVPILGYILRSDDGEALDFDEHNMSIELVKGRDGYELREFYEEQVIGIIPETNDYHYEMINGVNHVCCTGYIFKSYSNGGADLVENCEGKGVSMEISVNSGNMVDGLYHIDNYQYQAVTVLGDHVPQGMNGTCNVKKFSFDNSTKQRIENICEEIQKLNQGKEDCFMDNPAEIVEFEETKKVDETVVEETPATIEEPSTLEETEPQTEAEPETQEVEEEVAETVEVTEEVTEAPESEDVEGTDDEFACAPKKKKKYEDEEDEEKKEDKFSLECFGVFFGEEVPATLSEVCDALVDKFNVISSELEELKEFKASIEKESLIAEIDNVCAEFDLTDEEISDVKEKAYAGEMGVKEFKKELFALTGMKALANKNKFAQKETVAKPKIAVVETEKIRVSDEPYGGLFAKYGKK